MVNEGQISLENLTSDPIRFINNAGSEEMTDAIKALAEQGQLFDVLKQRDIIQKIAGLEDREQRGGVMYSLLLAIQRVYQGQRKVQFISTGSPIYFNFYTPNEGSYSRVDSVILERTPEYRLKVSIENEIIVDEFNGKVE